MATPEPPPSSADLPAPLGGGVVASDGGTVHLRPIRPEDADALVAFPCAAVRADRYLRFFGPYLRMPQRDAAATRPLRRGRRTCRSCGRSPWTR